MLDPGDSGKHTRGREGHALIVLEGGGSVWESNPPKSPQAPPNGFEDRTSHQARSAPLVALAAMRDRVDLDQCPFR